MYATRTWKRDGSQNHMSLDMAARNLKENALDTDVRKMRPETIAGKLEAGELIETRLAVFSLYG